MRSLRRILTVAILLVMTTTTVAGQQARRQRKAGPQKPAAQKSAPDKSAFAAETTTPAVSLVSGPSPPEYLSGEASVSVHGNENPIIRIGLAQGGVTLIEFPASDRFFALHPGNSDMVTLDDSPTKWRDTFFVFRAGAGFVPPPPGASSRGPAASIIAQMQSGLVVTFLIYPVRDLSEMAHRVVVMYNRDDVVAARKLAGLAVDLGRRDQTSPPVTSIRVTDGNGIGRLQPEDTSTSVVDSFDSASASEEARKAIKSAIGSKIKDWSKPLHGIALHVDPVRDISDSLRLVVVAVRNTTSKPLYIIPSDPALTIQTRDESGKTLLVDYAKKVAVESSGSYGTIPGGGTIYYAIVFRRPILGAHQSLRISVAQSNAVDEPIIWDLQ